MSLNPIRPWRNIERRKSRQIMVGNVPVGGDAPISVQTMTNTNGHDVRATLDQVIRAADAGADIVRISAPDQETTRALREICRESPVPIVADIHFHYKRAIEAAGAGAAPGVDVGRWAGISATRTGRGVRPRASSACGSEWTRTPSTRRSRAFISGMS